MYVSSILVAAVAVGHASSRLSVLHRLLPTALVVGTCVLSTWSYHRESRCLHSSPYLLVTAAHISLGGFLGMELLGQREPSVSLWWKLPNHFPT